MHRPLGRCLHSKHEITDILRGNTSFVVCFICEPSFVCEKVVKMRVKVSCHSGLSVTRFRLSCCAEHMCGLLVLVFCGLCVSVSLSVGHNHEPYKNGRTIRGSVWGMGPGYPKEEAIFLGGGISQPIVKCRNRPSCGRYSHSYSVGSSSDAAFRCQYCNSLFEDVVERR